MLPISPLTPGPGQTNTVSDPLKPDLSAKPDLSDESKLKFEQLLWAELLTHTGLEDALTLGGGDGASMFARYFVEAIAEDIAKQHPLGLLDEQLPDTRPGAQTPQDVSEVDRG
ncbi:MAG: hypothetical protein AAF437_14660 [Pseudomonadota bacterium]